jgi:hypothetical protein
MSVVFTGTGILKMKEMKKMKRMKEMKKINPLLDVAWTPMSSSQDNEVMRLVWMGDNP